MRTTYDPKGSAQASIDDARKHLVELHAGVTAGAKAAAKNADRYVRDNPWSTMAMIAGLGIVVGYLAARRQSA